MSANLVPLDIVGAMLIGYAQVSTKDQDPVHQVDALRRGGVDPGNIYVDVAGGAKGQPPRVRPDDEGASGG
jgi:DNA invertase Pin-like site-specific DNA recombinase